MTLKRLIKSKRYVEKVKEEKLRYPLYKTFDYSSPKQMNEVLFLNELADSFGESFAFASGFSQSFNLPLKHDIIYCYTPKNPDSKLICQVVEREDIPQRDEKSGSVAIFLLIIIDKL